jgi:hypothetical protein
MDDIPTDPQRSHHAHVVVHPVVDADPPFRRVDILGFRFGKAYSLADVAEFVSGASWATRFAAAETAASTANSASLVASSYCSR